MAIVADTEKFVTDLLTEKLSEDHRYHDLPHTLAVRDACIQIGNQMDLSKNELEILELASLLHDVGYAFTYQGHEAESLHTARNFLHSHGYPEHKLAKVLACIDVTYLSKEPSNTLEEVIKDADLSNLGRENYLELLANLRHEWAVFRHETYDDQEWIALNRKFLKDHQYYTSAARELFGDQKKANQKLLKKMEKKEEISEKKDKKDKKDLSTISGSRSAQMMFKTALRNHLDLSNLADNKANIMLSVNALIITIAMPLAASYVTQYRYLLIPMITLLGTCLASMIFATLATRPIKMTGYTSEGTIRQRESNLFFFGNFFEMTYDEYKKGMQLVVADEENLENAIMRDLYFLGRSLGRKYQQLRTCYTIFMFGVVITVMIFGILYSMSLQE